jgi:hypothetical protein
MSYVFWKWLPVAGRGWEWTAGCGARGKGTHRKIDVPPVRCEMAGMVALWVTKDTIRIEFQEHDIANIFLPDREPRPPSGTDLVALMNDGRPPRIGIHRAPCSLDNDTILTFQGD